MLKKTITYTDYNDVERTEDFYFNLSEAELMEMELTVEGGMFEKLQRIIKSKNGPEIVKFFKEMVLKAYGVKSDDGRRFIKSDELSQAFSQTEAYSQLYMEFATNDKAAAEFVNGIMPKKVQEKSKAAQI